MAIIYTYPVKAFPSGDDLVLISDESDNSKTKQVRVSTFPGGTNSGVDSLNQLVGSINIIPGTNTTVDLVNNNIQINASSNTPSLPFQSIQFRDANGNFSGNQAFLVNPYSSQEAAAKLTVGDAGQDLVGAIEIQSDENGAILKIGGGSQLYYTTIRGSDVDTASYNIILPPAGPGGNNKILESTSTGILSWINKPVGLSPVGGAGSVQFESSAGTFNGDSELTYDGFGGLTVGEVGGNGGIITLQPEDGVSSGVLKIGHLNSTEYLSLGLGGGAMSASYSIDFPTSVPGGNNKMLQSDASGVLSWIPSPSASITGTTAVNTTNFANTPFTFANTNSGSAAGAPVAIKVASGFGNKHIAFYYATTLSGSISQSGVNAVAYNTSSDYRLKENVVDMTDSIDRLKQLKPSRFNFITDGPSRTVDGFLAHEVSPIVPEAVTGIKDAVDADNNIIPQGIDQSKLVPLLVGAIKELTARIEALEA